MVKASKIQQFRHRKLLLRSILLTMIAILLLLVLANIWYRRQFRNVNFLRDFKNQLEENIVNGILQNFQDEQNFYRVKFKETTKDEQTIIVKNVFVESSIGTLKANKVTIDQDFQYIKLEGRPKLIIYAERLNKAGVKL